jgi:hypothetical protein
MEDNKSRTAADADKVLVKMCARANENRNVTPHDANEAAHEVLGERASQGTIPAVFRRLRKLGLIERVCEPRWGRVTTHHYRITQGACAYVLAAATDTLEDAKATPAVAKVPAKNMSKDQRLDLALEALVDGARLAPGMTIDRKEAVEIIRKKLGIRGGGGLVRGVLQALIYRGYLKRDQIEKSGHTAKYRALDKIAKLATTWRLRNMERPTPAAAVAALKRIPTVAVGRGKRRRMERLTSSVSVLVDLPPVRHPKLDYLEAAAGAVNTEWVRTASVVINCAMGKVDKAAQALRHCQVTIQTTQTTLAGLLKDRERLIAEAKAALDEIHG